MFAVATRTKNAVILDVQTLQTTMKKFESENSSQLQVTKSIVTLRTSWRLR